MRVLLTEGSGLTSRQVAGRLHAAGHEVGVLSSDPIFLTRFTNATHAWHRVPAFGTDPLAWLDAAVDAYVQHGYDVLFPTQEPVTVLSATAARLGADGVVTAAPPFGGILAVQDKVAAAATLARLGVPQPPTTVMADRAAVARFDDFPAFVKTPIGTASGGVQLVRSRADLERLAAAADLHAAFDLGGLVAQAPVDGPLAMVQSVFDGGELVAFHANLRVREGARGGASHKRSIELPGARTAIERLGTALGWHGALSADVIVGPDGPVVIDVNPRLVEPANAWAAGVDLVGALLDVATGTGARPQPAGRAGVDTHQLGLAVLGAAAQGRGRRGIAAELTAAILRRGSYRHSTEELTPIAGDPTAAIPLAAIIAATLVAPGAWQWFAGGSVANYALSPAGWQQIRRAHTEIGAGAVRT
jgi:biotin carboxylase